MIVWSDNRLVPLDRVRLDPRDRGLLLGDGLFETLLSADGKVFYLAEHLARLRRGCALLELEMPADDDCIARTLSQLLEANGLRRGRAVLRITLSRGVGPRGLVPPSDPAPNLLIAAERAPAVASSATLMTSHQRRNEHSLLSSIKSLSYLESVLAAAEARRAGADEALLLNTSGALAEASSANVFLRHDTRLRTPRQEDGALGGILRARVLALAPEIGCDPSEARCTVRDLETADEVLLTNSVGIVRSVVRFEGRPVGSGRPGSCAQALRALPEIAQQLG
jgi:branched-chain amino acid aminotransferase